jgi:hypothetical protein
VLLFRRFPRQGIGEGGGWSATASPARALLVTKQGRRDSDRDKSRHRTDERVMAIDYIDRRGCRQSSYIYFKVQYARTLSYSTV